jgi:hypothetical protein
MLRYVKGIHVERAGSVIFSFIQEHKELWPVRVMCRTLGVSTQGFYTWCSRPTSNQQQRRDAILVKIRTVHAECKSRRVGTTAAHASTPNSKGMVSSVVSTPSPN